MIWKLIIMACHNNNHVVCFKVEMGLPPGLEAAPLLAYACLVKRQV
jgi:hypothetical protein